MTSSAHKIATPDRYSLPSDLYVPEHALYIKLASFEGPLDLLLYLIKRQKLDILALPMADLTQQYLHYLDMMQRMDLDPAAEYLAMAAWLTEIKSRTLLPKLPSTDIEEDDPRAELVARLQEYEHYKTASEALEQLPRLQREFFYAFANVHPDTPKPTEEVTKIATVTPHDLAKVMQNVLKRATHFTHHQVKRQVMSVQDKLDVLKKQLADGKEHSFYQLLVRQESRLGVVLTLLAVLELTKLNVIRLSFDTTTQDISVAWNEQ